MLGKEDVLLWFKDLESYQRLNLMYDLLNMCMPFEVRFVGTCVEEIGKHSYQELRGPSIEANDVERLAKEPSFQIGIVEEETRHRAAVYMSVMHARNCSCANWYYRTLFRTVDPVEHVVKVLAAKEEFSNNVVNELLLLYTIGLYHPAFTFEQKSYFRNALFNIVEHCNVDVIGKGSQPDEKTTRSVSSQSDDIHPVVIPVIPLKTPSVMSLGDLPSHALSQLAPIQSNLLPRFPSGPPEVRPFTAQSNTSLVRQTASPPHSRALSPQQSYSGPITSVLNQSPLHLLPVPAPHDTIIVPTPPLHLDSNLVTSGPLIPFVPLPEATSICSEEENHFISEEKKELLWPNEQIAKQNGMRYNKNYYPQHEQLVNIKNEPDKPPSVHCSNSTSSSGSSRNQSPSETPSVTPAVTPHGPGRGNAPAPPQLPQPPQPPQDTKPRVNGLPPPPPPQFIAPPCEQPPFSTVPPFSNFQQSVPQPPRNPNCCNCGAMGHTMVDCTSQSVEEITQTPYTLDYDSPTVPDNPPEK